MKTSRQNARWWSLFFTITLWAGNLQSQETASSPLHEVRPFRLDSNTDVERIRRIRADVILSCVAILDKRASSSNSSPELDAEAARAAELLGEMRANDGTTIHALCRNLTLRRGLVEPFRDDGEAALPPGISPNLNLSGGRHTSLWLRVHQFVVVKALRRIGGRAVTGAVVNHMKDSLDRNELLLCAFSLGGFDNYNGEREVALVRLRAVEKQLFPNGTGPKELKENLATVKMWLKDPEFRISNPNYTPYDAASDY